MDAQIRYKGKTIFFKDSLSIVSMKLADFPSSFNLECGQKEMFPYKYYTFENFKKLDCKGIISEAGKQELKHRWNQQQFENNLNKLNIIEGANGDKIGYLQISKFNETAYEQFNQKLNKIEATGINSLIIDLRGNTGGFLSAATNISELFLKKGEVIYSLNEQSGTKVTYDETEESRNYKVFVLVNESSASASEILAAALQDSYGALLVGTTTYGKGKVQKTNKMSDGTMYKYTSAKWLTPKGECIDGVGLKPDIEISNGDELLK